MGSGEWAEGQAGPAIQCAGPQSQANFGALLQDIQQIFYFLVYIDLDRLIFCTIEQLLLLRLIVYKAIIAQPYKKDIENLQFLAKLD